MSALRVALAIVIFVTALLLLDTLGNNARVSHYVYREAARGFDAALDAAGDFYDYVFHGHR